MALAVVDTGKRHMECISTAMVRLAAAVDLAVRRGDRDVVAEMQTVADMLFEQASIALQGENRNAQ